jgi:hypothetical protein
MQYNHLFPLILSSDELLSAVYNSYSYKKSRLIMNLLFFVYSIFIGNNDSVIYIKSMIFLYYDSLLLPHRNRLKKISIQSREKKVFYSHSHNLFGKV